MESFYDFPMNQVLETYRNTPLRLRPRGFLFRATHPANHRIQVPTPGKTTEWQGRSPEGIPLYPSFRAGVLFWPRVRQLPRTALLTEQLLYAILAQLNKINYQLDRETNHEGWRRAIRVLARSNRLRPNSDCSPSGFPKVSFRLSSH